MQVVHEQSRETNPNPKEVATAKRRSEGEEESKFGYKKLNPFSIFLCRRDIAKACFHSTLNLKRPGCFSSQHNHHHHHRISNNPTMKMMTKEDIARGLGIGSHNSKADAMSNKVLPVVEGQNKGSAGEGEEEEKAKNEKYLRSISRMKDLLRWAAAAKSQKGGKFLGRKVLHFRNRATLTTVPDDEQMSNESPKISFRREVESCPTTTPSAYSMASSRNDLSSNISSTSSTPLRGLRHCSSRRGNWITSDNEFVVLEL